MGTTIQKQTSVIQFQGLQDRPANAGLVAQSRHVPFPRDLEAMMEVAIIAEPNDVPAKSNIHCTKMFCPERKKHPPTFRSPDLITPPSAPRRSISAVKALPLTRAPVAAAAVPAPALMARSRAERAK